MGEVTILGIDLAKDLFHVHGVDERGRTVLQQRVSRKRLSGYIANLPRCRIGIESCGGAHYWARVFESHGHDVGMMNPKFVKPYVKSNKNDRNDAEGICEAVGRENMRFVARKTVEQQDLQMLHRIRQRLVGERSGRSYGLGEAMRVKVHRVDMETRRIDFRPAGARSKGKSR